MFRRIVSWVICLCMLLSFAGCTSQPDPTEPPQTTAAPIIETTVPPVTEPPADELYSAARAEVENAANLVLTVTMSRKRSVGGETYSEAATQTISMQNLGQDNLRVSVQDSTTVDGYVLSSQEYYEAGQVWMLFENLPFTSEMDAESYLDRFLPALLLDASLYGSVTAEATAGGYNLTFSEPTAAESWLTGEQAELHSAQGTAVLDSEGHLVRTGYIASYTFGSTRYDVDYSVAVSIPETLELSNTLPASGEEYVTLSFIDAPWVLSQATYDIMASTNLTCTTVDTMVTQAGGAVFSQQEYLDLYGTGADTMTNYKLSINLQDYTGVVDEYELVENTQKKILKITENDGNPASRLLSEAQVNNLRTDYVNTILDFVWEPADLTGATIEDLGSVYLLELTGNDALGEVYEGAACKSFWTDENFLRNLASDYRTDTLSAYLSIDKYSGLPVAFGFTYEGIHTIQGGEYLLSDQWDQTFFLGSNTAYEAITEEPLPDSEPEEKAKPLFYHVTGENGQEMWLIGTIHVGDDRTGYLPQEIYDALLASDALAVEFDMDAFDEALENDDNLLSQVQSAYFYADGSMTKEHLDEEIYERGVKMLKATGNYFMNAEYLKPYLWSQSIDNFMLRQGYALTSDKGVDNRLLDIARDNEIKILDVESGLFQIQMMTGYSAELQELLLEESLYTDSAAYCESVGDLYEKWCAGDEAVLREELSDEVDTSEFTEEELQEYEAQKHLIEEYNKAMSYDRNDGMLKKAIEYLESGEVIFYAVGLAHLLNDVNGLVDTLRDAGYTVELVSYGG